MSTPLETKIRSLFVKPKVLEPRTLYFNQQLPPEAINPNNNRPLKEFDKNEIRTTKFTPFSFIPKDLFYQFHNIANVYFLFLIILGFFDIFGVEDPILSAVPLICIVIITAIKDAFEDSRRTISDLELNNNSVSILKGIDNCNVDEKNISIRAKFNNFNATIFVKMVKFFGLLFHKRTKSSQDKLTEANNPKRSIETFRSDIRGGDDDIISLQPMPTMQLLEKLDTNGKKILQSVKFKKDHWKNIKVGDIVRLHNNEECPADLLILSTSDKDNRCFVETRNLDGETNLKARQGLLATSEIKRGRDLVSYKFKVKSEAPDVNMYNYNGTFISNDKETKEEKEEPINISNLVLRGSNIKNTKWVIGYTLFTGHETKVMLNSGVTPTKRSRIQKDLNVSVVINFTFLFILCLVSAIVNGVFYEDSDTSFTYFEYDAYGSTPAINAIINFFVAMNIYQALVPISLYITVEIIKTLQAFFIYSDVELYYPKLDYPCTPKSWNISDDLGQIEYIFSDKTGTLTQNVMEFKKATVNGKSYGLAYTEAQAGMDKRKGIDIIAETEKWKRLIQEDKERLLSLLSKLPLNDQFHEDRLTFISSEYIHDLNDDSNPEQRDATRQFMLCLSVCHTVLTEPSHLDDSKLEFKAESPDEAALVEAANDVGYTFLKRLRTGGLIRIQGEEKEFELLKILEFNSTRKRMSVVVKIDGKLLLITKGADSVIFARLDPEKNDKMLLQGTAENLEKYASEGLRTLCVASRELAQSEYEEWEKEYDKAAASIEDREDKIEAACDIIERNFILHGGTAIEDRLQEGVPESIEKLGKAGIKLWVLTGDKVETAINIGFSCNLLGNNMELLVIRPDVDVAANATEEDIKNDVDGKLTGYLKKFEMVGSLDELKKAKNDHSIPTANTAVIIDGAALLIIFGDKTLQRKFLLLCKQCKAVICCRVSPKQKAQVVELVKVKLDVMTLAIGDGANDVAMIQMANVGVGIVGEEGRQAAMSSDYAIGQFRFLERLILVHGRWDYKRLAEVVPTFFYKNVIFALALFWYGIYNNFDGSYLLQYTMIMFYNLAFTSLPVIILGALDQDVSDKISLQVPQIYKTGILRQEWSQYKFLWYMLDGLYQSVISFFFPYLIYHTAKIANYNGLGIDHRFWIGVIVTHISVTSADLYVLLRQKRWDWLTLLLNAISILLVFFWIGVYTTNVSLSTEFYKAAPQMYGSLVFWVCFVAGVLACMLPRFVLTTLQVFFRPKDIDIIRECAARGDFDEGNASSKESWSDKEKDMDIGGDSVSPINSTSLEHVRTSHSLPELSQAHSLVRTFTEASSQYSHSLPIQN